MMADTRRRRLCAALTVGALSAAALPLHAVVADYSHPDPIADQSPPRPAVTPVAPLSEPLTALRPAAALADLDVRFVPLEGSISPSPGSGPARQPEVSANGRFATIRLSDYVPAFAHVDLASGAVTPIETDGVMRSFRSENVLTPSDDGTFVQVMTGSADGPLVRHDLATGLTTPFEDPDPVAVAQILHAEHRQPNVHLVTSDGRYQVIHVAQEGWHENSLHVWDKIDERFLTPNGLGQLAEPPPGNYSRWSLRNLRYDDLDNTIRYSVYSVWDGWEYAIQEYDIDTGTVRQVDRPVEMGRFGRGWKASPSLDWVVFPSKDRSLGGNDKTWRLFRRNVSTGETERLRGPGIGEVESYEIFDDGSVGLYSRPTHRNHNRQITLWDPDGDVHRLSSSPAGQAANRGVAEPTWDPHGRFVVFVSASRNLVGGALARDSTGLFTIGLPLPDRTASVEGRWNAPAVTAEGGAGSIAVTWEPVNRAQAYRYRVREAGASWSAPTTVGTDLGVVIDSLEDRRVYDIAVSVRRNGRWQPRWSEVSVVASGDEPVGPPVTSPPTTTPPTDVPPTTTPATTVPATTVPATTAPPTTAPSTTTPPSDDLVFTGIGTSPDVTGSVSPGTLHLELDPVPNAQKYRYRIRPENGSWSRIIQIGLNATITIDQLDAGTTYELQVGTRVNNRWRNDWTDVTLTIPS